MDSALSRLRTRLAMRDESRRTHESPAARFTRQPVTASHWSSCLSIAGMSCGSFWRSASMTTTWRPRTAFRPAAVAAAVVHEDDLVAQAGWLEDLADLRPEQREILLFVVHRHHDGEIQRGR